MIWNDATKLRPIKNGGVYVLAVACAAGCFSKNTERGSADRG